jgi:XapX domain-containing protein
MNIALGLLLAFGIGAVCRVAGVPLPAPPVLIGALLVVAMSTGYVLTDRVARHRETKHRALFGRPSGEPPESTPRVP